MIARAALAALAATGLPASAAAQETVTYSWTWFEVIANSSTPVATPNGLVEPGEGARLALTATVSPGIGSPVTYQAPPHPGHGTLAALGSIYFDLLGTKVDGGQWSVFRRGHGFALGSAGTPEPDGSITSAGAGQFVLSNTIVNNSNPVINIWAATWTPGQHAARLASFQSQGAAAGQGNHSAILIQYGEDPEGNPLYVGRFIRGQFGNSGPIPIVPAPAGLALLCLSGLAATRRRPNRRSLKGSAP